MPFSRFLVTWNAVCCYAAFVTAAAVPETDFGSTVNPQGLSWEPETDIVGCVYRNRTYAVGERWVTGPPDKCAKFLCEDNDQIAAVTCPWFIAPPGCGSIPGDKSAPYPHCCPKKRCPPNSIAFETGSGRASQASSNTVVNRETEISRALRLSPDHPVSPSGTVAPSISSKDDGKPEVDITMHNTSRVASSTTTTRSTGVTESSIFLDVQPSTEIGSMNTDSQWEAATMKTANYTYVGEDSTTEMTHVSSIDMS